MYECKSGASCCEHCSEHLETGVSEIHLDLRLGSACHELLDAQVEGRAGRDHVGLVEICMVVMPGIRNGRGSCDEGGHGSRASGGYGKGK